MAVRVRAISHRKMHLLSKERAEEQPSAHQLPLSASAERELQLRIPVKALQLAPSQTQTHCTPSAAGMGEPPKNTVQVKPRLTLITARPAAKASTPRAAPRDHEFI